MRKDKAEGMKKRTLIQNISMIIRAVRLVVSASGPGPYLSAILYRIAEETYMLPNILLSAEIINEIAGECRKEALFHLVVITVVVNALLLLLKALLGRLKTYYAGVMSSRNEMIYTKKMLGMDYIEADNVKNHELLSLIKFNTSRGGFGISKIYEVIPNLLGGLCKTIGAAALTVSLFTVKLPESAHMKYLDSWWVTVSLFIVLVFLSVILPYALMRSTEKYLSTRKKFRRNIHMFAFLTYEFSARIDRAKDVRIYSQEFSMREAADTNVAFFPGEYIKARAIQESLGEVASHIFTAVVYLYVAAKAILGAFGVGSIARYVGAITQFAGGLSSVVKSYAELIENNVYLESTYEFLDIPNSMVHDTQPVEKEENRKCDIEFSHVSFLYPGTEKFALQDISVKINDGDRIAVVGMNGSGKTTFIKLLGRLYDPTAGEIKMNGTNIRKYDYKQYQDTFSIVFQDFALLPLKLGENVAASVTYDAEKAGQCLELAGFGERLESLEDGLDTWLYKDFHKAGIGVSGGEAQKIAIARALYRNAPFVILDEPTAALDPKAEFEIYARFNDMVGDKTAIYISHRLSSCRFCKKILVFDEGRIVEVGNHEELLKKQGKYHELWCAQAQYYGG